MAGFIRRRRKTFSDVLSDGFAACPDCNEDDRLVARMAVAFNAHARAAIFDFISKQDGIQIPASASFEDVEAGRLLDPDNFQRWLDLFIEYAPKILEIVLMIVAALA